MLLQTAKDSITQHINPAPTPQATANKTDSIVPELIKDCEIFQPKPPPVEFEFTTGDIIGSSVIACCLIAVTSGTVLLYWRIYHHPELAERLHLD